MALSISSAGPCSVTAGQTAPSVPQQASAPLGRRPRTQSPAVTCGSVHLTPTTSRPIVAVGASFLGLEGPLGAPWQCESQRAHSGAIRRHRLFAYPSVVFSGDGRYAAGFGTSSVPGSSGGPHPLSSCVVRRLLLQPPAATGPASGGPAGQSPASTKGQYFNPRYHLHRHQQSPQQPPHPPQHQHPHSHSHQHQQHQLPAGQGRGAWSTPGPLAPGGGGPGGGTASTNPAGGSVLPYSMRTAGTAPAPQQAPASADSEMRRTTAGALSAPAVPSTTPTPSTAAAPSGGSLAAAAAARNAHKQPPSHGHGPHGTQPPSSRSAVSHPTAPSSNGAPPREGSPQCGLQPSAGGPGHMRVRTQLERLYIKDFALVSEQTVRLGSGVNVITGESGSGKSVLVEAFSQVLGAPAPQECVRAPAEVAVVEGTFLVGEEQRGAVRQLLSSCGLPQRVLAASATAATPSSSSSSSSTSYVGADEGAAAGSLDGDVLRLTVRREIAVAPAGGLRSRVFLNGAASSLRVLRELGALLVDTNGQHSSSSLRDPVTQLDLLDRIAGTGPLADSYCAALGRLREVEGRLDELDELDDEEERARMQKLVDAVAKLRVQAGEERELRRMLKKMEARRNAVEQCGLVRMALCGEGGAGGVTDALRTIEAQLNAILAQEEQNRAAAARSKAKDGAKAQGEAGDAAAAATGQAAGAGAATAAGGTGEEDAVEEEDEEGEEGEAAAGVRLMEEALDQVAAAKDMLAAAETMVRSYARRYQFSQADHDATAERLARLERLMKQASSAGFGGAAVGGAAGRGGSRITTTEQLLEAAAECSSKLASYYEMEGQREEWEAQVDALALEIRSLALQLSARRRAAAAALRSAVESCLRELAMGGSRFDVRIGWAEERVAPGGAAEGLYIGEEEAEEAGVSELGGRTYVMGARGLDQVEFLLAAGPAEPLRPLAAVASGGESARVMLALKAAPAQAVAAAAANGQPDAAATSSMPGGGVPIMILDELDSGIGARLGSAVGSILARMSLPTQGSNSQIICVTHLPQVACYAAHHIKVQKEQRLPGPLGAGDHDEAAAAAAGRVTTSFLPLTTFGERCEEVAAMLGLDKGVAEEMLRTAQGQVAALYPPGAAPNTAMLAAAVATAASASTRSPPQRAAAAGATLPSAPGGGVSGGGSPREEILRVVQDTLRNNTVSIDAGIVGSRAAAVAVDGGGADGTAGEAGRTSFVVSLSPAMDPNAVLVGGAGAGGVGSAAATAPDGAGARRTSDGGDDDDDDGSDAEEAELSAQLLAGVEAAALEHLARMEAQAKAAAAAAAAAAAIMGGGAVAADADAEAAPAAVAAPAGSWGPGQAGGEGVMAGMMMTHGGPLMGGFGGRSLGGAAQGAQEETVAPRQASASSVDADAAAGAEAAAPGAESLAIEVVASGAPGVSGPHDFEGSSGAAEPALPTDSVASGFVVAVQPSRSPLPYIFGSTSSTEEEEDDQDNDDRGQGTEAAPAAAAATAIRAVPDPDPIVHNGTGNGSEGGVGNQAGVVPPQPQPHYASYDSPYMGAGLSYGAAGDSYAYNVAAPGGRFVVVPSGHENEFTEMFATIMSFSREDYAGEAMRSHEVTLWQALRDSGLA